MSSVTGSAASFVTFSALSLLAVTLLSASATSGCSATTNVAGAPACDSSKCLEGNFCLPLNGETKCRKTCLGNGVPTGACPTNFTCVASNVEAPALPESCTALSAESFVDNCGAGTTQFACPTGAAVPSQCRRLAPDSPTVCCPQQSYCVADKIQIEPKPNGQWGFRCNASGGLENKDCDLAQEFYCNGQSPTDGDAYCTRYNCETDADCAAGFACETINVAPNVTTTKRSLRDTLKVCARRTYCSTCTTDFDCPQIDGRKQHCVTDQTGAGMCTPECSASTQCPSEAKCVDMGIGVTVCYPRAGVCKGDGSLCSPCRSDADCGDDGLCVKGEFTTERSCAKKSPQSCNKGGARGGCPESIATPKVTVACAGGLIDEVPPDYCHGIYRFGEGGDVGCWTPNR